jgi:hypothetical protein
MSKPQRRYGTAHSIAGVDGPDWSFLKDGDEPEPESPEALRARLRSEILEELSKKLATPTEPKPERPAQAEHVRSPGFDEFFALLQARKEEGRRRGH